MEDITLVIADPQDAIVARAREIMACWTSTGLLKPFLWWAGETDGDHRARWSNDDTEVDLSEEVAQEDYRTIRLVAFLPVLPGQEVTCATRRTADALRHALRQAAAPTQDVCSLTLVVPATQVTAIPPSSLASTWDVNLVAADEDRVTSGHSTTFVRRPDDLAPHAASVLATAAGLWHGMQTAPFDGRVEGAGLQDARVRVVRSFVRAVRSRDLVPAVTDEVFALAADDDWLEIALSVTSARDPEAVVTRAVEEYLAGPGALLTWTPHAPQRSAALRTVGLRDTLKALRTFLRRRTVVYPGELVDRADEDAAARTAAFFQSQTFGPEPRTRIRPAGHPSAAGSSLGTVLQTGTVTSAEAVLKWVEEDPQFTAFGDTWPALRALAFGLVDGGPLPDGCTEPRVGPHRVVVTAAEAICPDPKGGSFPLLPQAGGEDPAALQQVPACDPARARHAQALLAARAAPATAAGQEPAGAAAAELHEELERWLAQRRRSLLWVVGDRIVDGAKQAERELAGSVKTLREGPPGTGSAAWPDARPLRRAWLTLVAVALFGLGLATVARLLGAPAGVSAVIALLGLAGSLGGAIATIYGHLTARFELANWRNQALGTYLDTSKSAEHAARALVRLIAAYEQYLDWANVISRVLFASVTPDEPAPEDRIKPCELTMPKAMDMTMGETDDERRTHLAFGVGKACVHRGWVGTYFAELAERQMAFLKNRWRRAEHEPAPDPDRDHRARAHLLGVLESGEPSALLTGWVRERVVGFLNERRPEELFSGLTDLKGQATKGSPTEFLTTIFPSPGSRARSEPFAHRFWQLRAGGPAISVKMTAWKSSSVDLPPSDMEVIPLRLNLEGQDTALTLLSARLDATQPMPLTDLAIFAPDPSQTPPRQDTDPPAPTGLG